MNFFDEIITSKKAEIKEAKEKITLDTLKNFLKEKEIKPRGFYKQIKNKVKNKEIALITEIKKASPSKGIIKRDFNHLEIAKAYKQGGATCLSVLTDKKYFQGNLKYIQEIKEVIDLPILRKDFIIDPYQVYESIYFESDCILLIVAALEKELLNKLFELCLENKIDSLTEVHNEKEMEIALDLNPPLIGINNRNLQTFETNLDTTVKLANKYKKDLKDKIIISESGIFTKSDINLLKDAGIYAFLVGEGLIIQDDISKATKVFAGL